MNKFIFYDDVYTQDKGIEPELRIFPITYNAARVVMVNKAGKVMGVNLRPHDLGRHPATHASRSGTPIEIVSKVSMRHVHLAHDSAIFGNGEIESWSSNIK